MLYPADDFQFIHETDDSKELKAYTIVRLLEKMDRIRVSKFGVSKFLKVYVTISHRPGSGTLSKITAQVKDMVEAKMLTKI